MSNEAARSTEGARVVKHPKYIAIRVQVPDDTTDLIPREVGALETILGDAVRKILKARKTTE